MSSSEDCLAGSLLPGSGWSQCRMSSSEDCLAGSLLPGSGWSQCRMSSSEDCSEALLGRFTPSRLWLKLWPNVKIWRFFGRSNCTVGAPMICVIPCRTNSPAGTGDPCLWMKHQAAYKSVGTEVQESVPSLPTMPCSCSVWWSMSCAPRYCKVSCSPFFGWNCFETSWCTSQPKEQELSFNINPSPFSRSTWRSIRSESLLGTT